MKISQYLTAILFFFLLSSLGCKKETITQEYDYLEGPDNYIVRINECKDIAEGVSICYLSLIEDSRCPEDVVCFWSGVAVIKVRFKANLKTNEFNMIIPGPIGPRFENASQDTTIDNYHIKFVDLFPRPRVNVPADYHPSREAVFEITW